MAHLQLGERKKKKKEERERNTGVERRQERLGNAPQQALGGGERLPQAVPLAALPRRALASLLRRAPKSGSCQHRLPGGCGSPERCCKACGAGHGLGAGDTQGRAEPAAKAGVQACTVKKPPAPLRLPVLHQPGAGGGVRTGLHPPFMGERQQGLIRAPTLILLPSWQGPSLLSDF